MNDYKESLKKYSELFTHLEAKADVCQWYQNNCRFYNDEIIYKKETYFWQLIKVGLFYLIIVPLLFMLWGLLCLGMKIYNWRNK